MPAQEITNSAAEGGNDRKDVAIGHKGFYLNRSRAVQCGEALCARRRRVRELLAQV